MRSLLMSCLVAALLSHAGFTTTTTAARLPGEQRIPNLAASLVLPAPGGRLPGEERVPVITPTGHLPEEERVDHLAAAVSAQKQAILERKERARLIRLRKER